MNEKYVEALEQYELEVLSVRRGRGAWICETDQGFRLLKEYRGTVRRLEFEDQVLEELKLHPGLRVDRYIHNREGSILSITGDGTRYVLKEWYADRECDLNNREEICLALSRLALLHRALREVKIREEWNLGSILTEPLKEELNRHNRELVRARNFIRSKRGKTEFELCVIESYDCFYAQARRAARLMEELWSLGGGLPSYLCHGDLDHHHLLMGNGFTAVIGFNRMHLGLQVVDLYRFMRKVMEKHDWDVELGISMLKAYEGELPLTAGERKALYCLFLYPEKYWKQINFYYNNNKAWIPARNTEKLRRLKEQQTVKERFLEVVYNPFSL